jgi:hypothetical protein
MSLFKTERGLTHHAYQKAFQLHMNFMSMLYISYLLVVLQLGRLRNHAVDQLN